MNAKMEVALQSQWSSLRRDGKELKFRKGQILAYEGHIPYGIFVLTSGSLEFSHADHQGEHPCEGQHLVSMSLGQIFAMEQFFSDSPLCCTCRAATDCTVIFISKTQLLPLVTPPPEKSVH